jgi:hypothetical protein
MRFALRRARPPPPVPNQRRAQSINGWIGEADPVPIVRPIEFTQVPGFCDSIDEVQAAPTRACSPPPPQIMSALVNCERVCLLLSNQSETTPYATMHRVALIQVGSAARLTPTDVNALAHSISSPA